MIAGLLIGSLTAVFSFEHFYWTRQTDAALEDQLRRWEQRYKLTSDQVNRLRTIEREYHGSGDPLLIPAHSSADDDAHARLLREIMETHDESSAFVSAPKPQ